MASLKCPVCGQRILNPGALELCPNCGKPSGLQLPAPEEAQASTAEGAPLFRLVVDDRPPAGGERSDDTAPNPIVSSTMPDSLFPKGFPKRPPDLEGTVILIESHEEPKRAKDAGETIFNILLDIIWAIPGTMASQQSKEKDKVQVTRMRIRTYGEMQRDVRLEGRLTGVNIAQGDRISLWGKERHGLLAFQHGYNHTAQGSIRTSKMAAQKSGLLLLLVALLGMLALWYYYHR